MSEKEYDVTITVRVTADSPDDAKMKAAYALATGNAQVSGTRVKQCSQVFQD